MSSAHAIPILLGLLMVVLVSLVVWGFVRFRSQQTNDLLMRTRDDLLLGLLVLAAFISGAFLTHVLLRVGL